jgi:iron-sulfur cluster repair protein YtfE (RIC family)
MGRPGKARILGGVTRVARSTVTPAEYVGRMHDTESLFRFHRRAERHLATLAALPAHLELYGIGPEISASAAALLHCFDHECVRHHAAEEHDVWPRIERSLVGPDRRADFRALRRALEQDHRELQAAWRELSRPLRAVSEGLCRRLDPVVVVQFRASFSRHIHVEEAALARHRIVTPLTSA